MTKKSIKVYKVKIHFDDSAYPFECFIDAHDPYEVFEILCKYHDDKIIECYDIKIKYAGMRGEKNNEED